MVDNPFNHKYSNGTLVLREMKDKDMRSGITVKLSSRYWKLFDASFRNYMKRNSKGDPNMEHVNGFIEWWNG